MNHCHQTIWHVCVHFICPLCSSLRKKVLHYCLLHYRETSSNFLQSTENKLKQKAYINEKCDFWQLVGPAGRHSLRYYTTVWMDRDGCCLHRKRIYQLFSKHSGVTLLIYIFPNTCASKVQVIIKSTCFKSAEAQYSSAIINCTFTLKMTFLNLDMENMGIKQQSFFHIQILRCSIKISYF